MSTPPPESKPAKPPRVANPLWVFSSFAGISEGVAGAIWYTTNSALQDIFGIFIVSFPCLVLAVFAVIVWKRPYVLYAPKDFADNVDVGRFVEAMGSNLRRGVEVAAQTAVESSAGVVAQELRLGTSDTELLVKKATDAAQQSVRASVCRIDLSRFLKGNSTLEFIVSQSSTVAELLDAIYASISGHVAPYTYGLSWVVSLKPTGARLVNAGTNWAMNNGRGNSDTRLLGEVGIGGGTEIDVLDLRGTGTAR